MARVTVEDCIAHLPNRFELVAIAAERAKNIASGANLTLDRDNDKDAVVSLREIADLTVNLNDLREEIIVGFTRSQPFDKLNRRASIEIAHHKPEETSRDVLDDLEEAQMGAAQGDKIATSAGMSFVDENVEVDD